MTTSETKTPPSLRIHKQRGESAASIRETIRFQTIAQKGSKVFLAGTFNDWDSESLEMPEKDESGIFEALVPLRPGRYEYKYVINGEWTADVKCPKWKINELGSLNSLLDVGGTSSIMHQNV